MLVAGFDIATTTGCADGAPGSKPRCWSWSLKKAGTRPQKLALLMAYCDRYFGEAKPDALYYEAGMTLRVALQVGCQDDTFALLRGAIGVVEACAARARIPAANAVGVQEARKHLVGVRSFPKGQSKDLVFRHCQALRWSPANIDESDACAIWSYGCAMSNPRTAHLTAPLFAR